MQQRCRYGSAAAVCVFNYGRCMQQQPLRQRCCCMQLFSASLAVYSHSTRLYYILTDDIRPVSWLKRLKWIVRKVAGVPYLCPTLAANAFRNFFQNVLCQKKNVRLIWKVGWWKRERNNGGLVSRCVICRKRFMCWHKQLSAKEFELDVLTQEREILTREHTEAV